MFLVLGVARENYSTLQHPVSSLALYEKGWIQQINFILSGVLVVLFSFGFGRSLQSVPGGKWTAFFTAAVGIGLVGAGIFTTDPVYGYPVSEPLQLEQVTAAGRLHEFFSLFVFLALPIAAFRMTRYFRNSGEKGWALYSLVSAIGVLFFLVLAGIAFKQNQLLVDYAGLFQRLCIITGCSWLSLVALKMLRKTA